jgi:1-acyl-sn-glycerol-3-phosphate acyltransferase
MTHWYRFCRFLYRVYFRVYHRGRVLHADRVPDTGAFILAGNHISFLDPPLFGQAIRRGAHYMARDTLFENPVMGRILRSWNVEPIARGKGDVGAFKTIMRLLREQKAVMMFPEGTRGREGSLQAARPGLGMIAARTHVPIVPMRITGSGNAMPRGAKLPRPARITIAFGEPFLYPLPADMKSLSTDQQRDLYQAIGDEVMRRIAALPPDDQPLPIPTGQSTSIEP